jgi:hypothetical protein
MPAMTPTQQWMFCLAMVYAIPSFLGGVGVTLLWMHRRALRLAAAVVRDNLDIYRHQADQLALQDNGHPDRYARLRDGWIKSLAG